MRPTPLRQSSHTNTYIQLSKIKRGSVMTAPRTLAKDLSFASPKSTSTTLPIARYATSKTCHLVHRSHDARLEAWRLGGLVFGRDSLPRPILFAPLPLFVLQQGDKARNGARQSRSTTEPHHDQTAPRPMKPDAVHTHSYVFADSIFPETLDFYLLTRV